MSRLLPDLPPRRGTAPFSAVPLGSAAAIRSANNCAKRSTRRSNGCEERLAIYLHYAKPRYCARRFTLQPGCAATSRKTATGPVIFAHTVHATRRKPGIRVAQVTAGTRSYTNPAETRGM